MILRGRFSNFLIFFILIISLSITLEVSASELVKKQDIVEVKEYLIQSGDTFWSISREHGVSIPVLKGFNQIEDNILKKGLLLRIPYYKTLYLVRVDKNDTLWSISQLYDTSVKNIKEFNTLKGETIYPGQHLMIIKDNPGIFYQKDELPTREEVFVTWKEDYWIIKALTDLAQDDGTRDYLQEEMASKDYVSRMELALMLEHILYDLKSDELVLQNDNQVNNIGDEEIKPGLEAVLEDDLLNIDLESNDKGLDETDTEKLERLVRFLDQELLEMNIKLEGLDNRTEELDNKADDLDKGVKKIETDVEAVDRKLQIIESDLEKEKEISEKNNQFKLEGLAGIELQTLEFDNLKERSLKQSILFNLHSDLDQTKEIDFFLQALYDYYNEGNTEIIIGSSGKFERSEDNYLLVDFAHQQPFNTNIGYKQTYFAFAWSLNSPGIDLEALTGHSNNRDGKNSLNSFDTMIKGEKIKVNFEYKEQDPYFVAMNVGGKTIPEERYFIGESYFPGENFLKLTEKRLSGTVIYPMSELIEVKGSLLKDDDFTGKGLGFNLNENNWNWSNDYIFWEEESFRDTSFWSSFYFRLNPVEVKVKFDHSNIGDFTYTILRTIGSLDLTDNVTVNMEYNALDEIETLTSFGAFYKF